MVADHRRGDGIHPKADLIVRDRGLKIIGPVGDLQARVIEHDVHIDVHLVDFAEHPFHLGKVVQVRRDGAGLYAQGLDLAHRLFRVAQVPAVENQVAPLLGHKERRQITDAPGRPGNQGPSALDLIHVVFPLHVQICQTGRRFTAGPCLHFCYCVYSAKAAASWLSAHLAAHSCSHHSTHWFQPYMFTRAFISLRAALNSPSFLA